MSTKTSTKRSRWLQVAGQLRHELPGSWALRGKGQRLRIVQEPVDWTLGSISYASTYDDEGYLYASVMPLVEPFTEWHLDYGVRIGDEPGTPGTVNLLADDGLQVARDFVLGPALAELVKWPAPRLADIAERSLAAETSSRQGLKPPWFMAAAWRVVNGSGSLVEPAQRALHFTESDRELYAPFRDFSRGCSTPGRGASARRRWRS